MIRYVNCMDRYDMVCRSDEWTDWYGLIWCNVMSYYIVCYVWMVWYMCMPSICILYTCTINMCIWMYIYVDIYHIYIYIHIDTHYIYIIYMIYIYIYTILHNRLYAIRDTIGMHSSAGSSHIWVSSLPALSPLIVVHLDGFFLEKRPDLNHL